VKTLFLDRDGVINKDPDGYFYQYEKLEYNYDVLGYIIEKFPEHTIIIVTNQSGIGRGYYTVEDFQVLMKLMIRDLKEYGINITDVYHSPFTPEGNHWSRKPNPGMLLDAQKKYSIDMSQSTMIGDKDSDYQASVSAGVKNFILYKEGKFDELYRQK